jgi:hypothetical protein
MTRYRPEQPLLHGLTACASRAPGGSGVGLKRVEMDLTKVVRSHEMILEDWRCGYDVRNFTSPQLFSRKERLYQGEHGHHGEYGYHREYAHLHRFLPFRFIDLA